MPRIKSNLRPAHTPFSSTHLIYDIWHAAGTGHVMHEHNCLQSRTCGTYFISYLILHILYFISHTRTRGWRYASPAATSRPISSTRWIGIKSPPSELWWAAVHEGQGNPARCSSCQVLQWLYLKKQGEKRGKVSHGCARNFSLWLWNVFCCKCDAMAPQA